MKWNITLEYKDSGDHNLASALQQAASSVFEQYSLYEPKTFTVRSQSGLKDLEVVISLSKEN